MQVLGHSQPYTRTFFFTNGAGTVGDTNEKSLKTIGGHNKNEF